MEILCPCYGMNVGNRTADGSMKPVEDADNDDYFEVDVFGGLRACIG